MAPKKKKTTATEREGVTYVRGVVDRANCIFHEIDQKNDFGNDAIMELVDGEDVRGICVGLQIKSGPSYFKNSSCVIQASRDHFEYWAGHSLPVLGIVYDPKEKCAYWINITELLKSDRDRIKNGPFTIMFDKSEINKFDDDGFQNIVLKYFLKKPIILDYDRSKSFAQSPIPDLHSLGIRSLLYGYRNADETWDILINTFKTRPAEAIDPFLIYVLALVPGHPDIFWHSNNIIDESLRKRLRERINGFSIDDVKKLLYFVGEEGFERGTLGQHVDAIISMVDDKDDKLKLLIENERLDLEIRQSALTLLAFYQQEAVITLLESLIGNKSDITEWANELYEYIKANGFVYFY